jgi:hypothetical protein
MESRIGTGTDGNKCMPGRHPSEPIAARESANFETLRARIEGTAEILNECNEFAATIERGLLNIAEPKSPSTNEQVLPVSAVGQLNDVYQQCCRLADKLKFIADRI